MTNTFMFQHYLKLVFGLLILLCWINQSHSISILQIARPKRQNGSWNTFLIPVMQYIISMFYTHRATPWNLGRIDSSDDSLFAEHSAECETCPTSGRTELNTSDAPSTRWKIWKQLSRATGNWNEPLVLRWQCHLTMHDFLVFNNEVGNKSIRQVYSDSCTIFSLHAPNTKYHSNYNPRLDSGWAMDAHCMTIYIIKSLN